MASLNILDNTRHLPTYTLQARDNPPARIDTGLKRRRRPADERDTMDMQAIALLLLAGVALTLYIMRRRSRQGKRTPKF